MSQLSEYVTRTELAAIAGVHFTTVAKYLKKFPQEFHVVALAAKKPGARDVIKIKRDGAAGKIKQLKARVAVRVAIERCKKLSRTRTKNRLRRRKAAAIRNRLCPHYLECVDRAAKANAEDIGCSECKLRDFRPADGLPADLRAEREAYGVMTNREGAHA